MKDEIIAIYNTNRNYYKKHLTKNHFIYLNDMFPWTNNLKEQIYCLRFNIQTQPVCKLDGCEKFANFKGMTEGYGVGGCCRKHGQYISNIKKHGYKMPFNSKEVLQKCKASYMKNYGVDNPMKDKGVSKKMANTKKNFSQEQKSQYLDKRTQTWRKKYGVDNIFKDVEFIEQCVKNKYGVRNVMQNPQISEKSMKSSFNFKEYVWTSGETSKVQGYEPIILNELETKGFTYSEVKTKRVDMPEIWYVNTDGKKCRYFPDLYIPHLNMVIEVKSEYTWFANLKNNILKLEATEQLGFDVKLEIR